MPRLLVESTLLASVTYDPDRTLLELEFFDGKRYQFFDVPPHYFQQLIEAPSKGGYFNRNIRNYFPYQKIAGIKPKN